MLAAVFSGFSLGFSLILAIGSQNAFVLRQGLRREHVVWVCLTCAVSDALLITAGVYGMGALTDAAPWFAPAMRYGGALFLFVYGLMAFRSAYRGGEALSATETSAGSPKIAILTALALAWLNPHVYLDTVVLLGSISAQYGEQRLYFGLGAIVSSFVFFFSLGFGARLVAPLFAASRSWQVLDVIIGCIMWSIAFSLIFWA